MSVTLTFTVERRTGNFGFLVLALTQSGYTPYDFKVDRLHSQPIDSIQMRLKDATELDKDVLYHLREKVPTIVDIQVDTRQQHYR